MEAHNYELTDAVAGFEEGDVLDVTARFGDWHTYQLKLEPKVADPRSPTVFVSESHGFSESAILDETARFGDWHEYDLTFDPGGSAERHSAGQVELTMETFERVTEPMTSSSA